MRNRVIVLTGLSLLVGASLLAQTAGPDVVAENLFPLELLMKYGNTIGVVESQRTFFREELEKSKERVADLQEKLNKEKSALAPLLNKDRIDEASALAQADKALAIDQQIKRENLVLLIHIKNRLTPDQQNQLTDIKARAARLQEKLRKTQETGQQWQASGKDLTELQALRDQFESQMKAGKLKEAEATLDKALKLLDAK